MKALSFSLPVAVLLISLLYTACLPEPLVIEDVPVAEEKIVVSSAFLPGRDVAIVLTENYSALTGDIEENTDLIEEILISDAKVSVDLHGERRELFEVRPGLYVTSQLRSIEGEVYTLHVDHPATGKSVTAETRLMPAVHFDVMNVRESVTGNDTFPQVYFAFQDPPEANWYMINVQLYRPLEDVLENFLDLRVYNYIFTDEEKKGNVIEDDFIAFVGEEVQAGDSIIVSLANISREYYHYLNKRNNRFFAIDLLSEPFNLPTNISNGYGFFTLHIPDNRTTIVRTQ